MQEVEFRDLYVFPASTSRPVGPAVAIRLSHVWLASYRIAEGHRDEVSRQLATGLEGSTPLSFTAIYHLHRPYMGTEPGVPSLVSTLRREWYQY